MRQDPPVPQSDDFDHLFPYLLLAVTITAFLPALSSGLSEPIGFDGFMHLSQSVQKSWGLFFSRWRAYAHPFLYLLVLRAVGLLGHSKLICRSASIIPGMAAIYLLGLIAAKLCRDKAVALLAAAAYGFSATMRDIIIDVRSYSLALLLVIAAFYCLVDSLASSGRRNRRLVQFGIFTSLAIASEYYAILFLAACLGTLVLLAATAQRLRGGRMDWTSRRWSIAAFGLPLAVMACFFQANLKNNLTLFSWYLPGFYWSPGVPPLDFVLRNLRAELNYMLPVEISSPLVGPGILTLFAPLLLYRGLFRKRTDEPPASGVPGLMFLLLLAELIILSLLRLYPFGGLARQQSILFPFFTLTAFLLLDSLLAWVSASRRLSWLKSGILGLAAAAIIVNFSGVGLKAAVSSWRQEAATRAHQQVPAGKASVNLAKPGRPTAGKAGILWVNFPGGTFTMGADDIGSRAQPRHKVRIKPFQMAKTLVTNKQYQACVDAGACTKADWEGPWFAGDYQPVVGVDWDQARAFSEWAGGRLPTEAEWEYAARSGGREQRYPWGDANATCELAVSADCGIEPTAPVCSKPAGDTQQGLCDMAGDAWQWVQDWYHASYLGAPADGRAWDGPASTRRVARGGSWSSFAKYSRSAFRDRIGGEPGVRFLDVGFRPAR